MDWVGDDSHWMLRCRVMEWIVQGMDMRRKEGIEEGRRGGKREGNEEGKEERKEEKQEW